MVCHRGDHVRATPCRGVSGELVDEPWWEKREQAQLHIAPRGFPGLGPRLAIILVNNHEERKRAGRSRLVTMRAQGSTVARNPVLQSGFRCEPRDEQGPVAFDAGGLKRFGTSKASVDGWMRFLQWLGRKRQLRNLP